MQHSSRNVQDPQPDALSLLMGGWGRELIDLHFQVLRKAVAFSGTLPGSGKGPLDAWGAFYEKEIQPFLKAPQVGLARYYQERSAHLVDKFNSWNKASIEFLRVVSGPLEKSIRSLQGGKGNGDGAGLSTSKELYQRWIEQLDSLYQDLLRSPDFIQCLSDTLDALEGFVTARTEYVQGLGKALQLPTLRDLDEAYRELYLLKKEVRALREERAEKSGRRSNRPAARPASRKR